MELWQMVIDILLFPFRIGGLIFLHVGGTVRYVYGTVIRDLGLTKRKRYQWKEYIWGVDETGEYLFDRVGHELVNKVIGMITLGLVFYSLT